MAESLYIPEGSPVKWIYIVGPGTGSINEGEIIRNNDPWPQGQTICRRYYPDYCQPYDVDDSVTIQIIHESTNYPDIALELRLSQDDSILQVSGFTVLSGNYKNGVIDFSNATAGDCVYLRLSSLDLKASIFGCGDTGNFETVAAGWGVSSGLTNTISRSNIVAHQGTYSCLIQASGTPAAAASEAFWCTAGNTVSSEGYYEISGWVYDFGSAPWTQNDEELYWTIDSGFAGATIVSQQRVTPSEDGRSQWHQIKMVFYAVAGALTGTLKIETGATPQANGFLFIDEVRLKPADLIEEAYTEPICVDDYDSCMKRVKYSSNGPSHEFFYDGSWFNFMRWPVNPNGQHFEDPEFKTYQTSAGANVVLRSKALRVYDNLTDWLPDWFLGKMSIALKHQNFLVNDTAYTAVEGSFTPEYPDHYAMGTAKWSMVDDVYNQQYTYQGT